MSGLEAGLNARLKQLKIQIDNPDGNTFLLRNVPTDSRRFSKPHTSVLVKRPHMGLPFLICVDEYLSYHGPNLELACTFTAGYAGAAGAFYLPFTATGGSQTVTNSLVSFTVGSFITDLVSAAPNTNVTPTFTMTITPTIVSASTPLTFYGTVTNPSSNVYDLVFSSSNSGPGQTYTWSGDPNGVTTFAYQNFDGFSFGIQNFIPVNSPGKTTTVLGFIGPATTTTPEPATVATTGIAAIALAVTAIRRKLKS